MVGTRRQTEERDEEDELREEDVNEEESIERRSDVEIARAEEARRVFWQLREIELEMRECRQERELQERRRARLERSKNQLLRGMAHRRSLRRGSRRRPGDVERNTDDLTSTTTF